MPNPLTGRRCFSVALLSPLIMLLLTATAVSEQLPVKPRARPAPIAVAPAHPSSPTRTFTLRRNPGTIDILRYPNESGLGEYVDVEIDGLAPDDEVTLVLSNGSPTAISEAARYPWVSAPELYFFASSIGARPVAPLLKGSGIHPHSRDLAHQRILQRNISNIRSLRQGRQFLQHEGAFATESASSDRSETALEVGDSKVWKDTFASIPKEHSTTLRRYCDLPDGRTALFWMETSIQSLLVDRRDAIEAFEKALCGIGGGYARLTALIGSPWGRAAQSHDQLLHDDPERPLDLNIVVLDVPQADCAPECWGGYFDNKNNYRQSQYSDSNQALALFFRAESIQKDLPYMISTIIHELTHLVNFYQRTVVRSTFHSDWLEETSAMMSEDLIGPTVQPPPHYYNNIEHNRIPDLLMSGAGSSYINWEFLSNISYSTGGAFGAFLNRRYGVSMLRRLTQICGDGTSMTSYTCLDVQVRDSGGRGMADELGRFAATLFGLVGEQAPIGFGYPQKTDESYTLAAFDLRQYRDWRMIPANPLETEFPATSQTYFIPSTSRSPRAIVQNVQVPPSAELAVIVQSAVAR